SSRAWSSPSSRGSCTPPTRSATTPTAGRCAAPTARAARTSSTPSRSPRTTLSSSPTGPPSPPERRSAARVRPIEPLQAVDHALGGDLLGGDGVPVVVAPVAVDVEVSLVEPLAAQAELLGDPVGGAVLGPDVDLYAVQAAHGQRVVDDEGQGRGGDALARVAAVDPVAGVGRAEGAAHDVADGETADELALPAHGERPARAVLDRASEPAEHGAERGGRVRFVPGGAGAGLP